MFRKSFVSLYITNKKLTILQLSSNKKKCKKKAIVNLPEGLIINNQVLEPSLLAKILEKAWVNQRIREKAVVLILPEGMSFIKTFELPKLKISELDEAVRWQAQEYFPSSLSELIIDWKIIRREEEYFKVLVVGVDRKTMAGYVSAVEQAGLWPLAVITPSVAFSFLPKSENGVLLIYRNSENVFVLMQGEEIVGTSVLPEGEDEKILKTSQRMLNHYKDVKLDAIWIVGSRVNDKLIEVFKSTFGLDVSIPRPRIEGISEAEIQDFFVPFASQLSEIAEPLDPTSINLLPKKLVEKYKFERLKLQVWSLTLAVTLFVWIPFLFTLASYFLIIQDINTLKFQLSQTKNSQPQRSSLINEITRINSISERILKIKALQKSPQDILSKINKATPQGLVVNSYEIDFEKGVIQVSGVASDRDVLISFKNNLELNPEFTGVDVPISSFEKEKDIEFNMILTFNVDSKVSKVSS